MTDARSIRSFRENFKALLPVFEFSVGRKKGSSIIHRSAASLAELALTAAGGSLRTSVKMIIFFFFLKNRKSHEEPVTSSKEFSCGFSV